MTIGQSQVLSKAIVTLASIIPASPITGCHPKLADE